MINDCVHTENAEGNGGTQADGRWSGIVWNEPGMVGKIIPEKFLYITGHS